jgi:hypothetical protein
MEGIESQVYSLNLDEGEIEAKEESWPVPTRAEELAYLDQLEHNLRNQDFLARNFPPDPTRVNRAAAKREVMRAKADFLLKFAVGAVLLSPVAVFLTNKSTARSYYGGIPVRHSQLALKWRFWSVFTAFDVVLGYIFAGAFIDKTKIYDPLQEYNLHEVRRRQL